MPDTRPGGRPLALTVGLWAPSFALSLGLVLVLLDVLRLAVVREHRPDVSALLMLEGYVLLFAALLVAYGGPRRLVVTVRFRYTSGRDVALAVGLWLVALLLGAIVSAALARYFGPVTTNTVQLLRASRDPLYLAVLLPTATLIAPAAEETLFRGAFFGWLETRLPAALAGVVSAALFAAAHRLPLAFPYLFIFGLAAAFVYHRTRSCFNTFVMHVCQNTLAVVATYALLARGGL